MLAIAFTAANAQYDPALASRDLFKFNLSPVVVKSFVVQYERVISKRQSLGLSFGYSPSATLPFKQLLLDRYGNTTDARSAIDNTIYHKYNATLEYRFYTGRRPAPAGFYLAPFVRYMHMKLDQDYQFTPNDGTRHTANLKSNVNAAGLGLLAGYQWLFARHFGVDCWIAGPFFGPALHADFTGYDPVGNLSADDQANLKNAIENGDIPGYTIDATVSRNTSGPATVNVKMKGPYYGIRALGVCLVYHF